MDPRARWWVSKWTSVEQAIRTARLTEISKVCSVYKTHLNLVFGCFVAVRLTHKSPFGPKIVLFESCISCSFIWLFNCLFVGYETCLNTTSGICVLCVWTPIAAASLAERSFFLFFCCDFGVCHFYLSFFFFAALWCYCWRHTKAP